MMPHCCRREHGKSTLYIQDTLSNCLLKLWKLWLPALLLVATAQLATCTTRAA